MASLAVAGPAPDERESKPLQELREVLDDQRERDRRPTLHYQCNPSLRYKECASSDAAPESRAPFVTMKPIITSQ